jgi:hypothetical protein
LGLARSTRYHSCLGENDTNLSIMHAIDELYTQRRKRSTNGYRPDDCGAGYF